MKYAPILWLFVGLILSSCTTHDYPSPNDVPDFKPAPMTKKQAQKELSELKKEREEAKTLLEQGAPL